MKISFVISQGSSSAEFGTKALLRSITKSWPKFDLNVHEVDRVGNISHAAPKDINAAIAISSPFDSFVDREDRRRAVLQLDLALHAHFSDVPKLHFLTSDIRSEMKSELQVQRERSGSDSGPGIDYAIYNDHHSISEILRTYFRFLGFLDNYPVSNIPRQGVGQNFGFDDDVRIVGISSPSSNGNDERRIHQLLPIVRECLDDLLGHSASYANVQPALVRNASRYQKLIGLPVTEIQWAAVWAAGIRLETATAAAERRISDRLIPELEDDALAALQSLRNLHGPLILATTEGRELQEQADRMQMTREQQNELRRAGNAIAAELKIHEELIEPAAAESVGEATDMIGSDPHPERGTVFGISALKNLTIVLVGAAMAAIPSVFVSELPGKVVSVGLWEVIKKMPKYARAVEQLGNREVNLHEIERHLETSAAIHTAGLKVIVERLAPFRSFIQANHEPLSEVANATPQLKWMLPYIDYIRRSS